MTRLPRGVWDECLLPEELASAFCIQRMDSEWSDIRDKQDSFS